MPCSLDGSSVTKAIYLHAMHLPDFSTSDELRHTPNTQRHHETVEPASAAAATAADCLHVHASDNSVSDLQYVD